MYSSQTANAILDTPGYFASGFSALAAPVRLVDTRPGLKGVIEQPGGSVGTDVTTPVAAGTAKRFVVTNTSGIPAVVAGLAVNVIVVSPPANGYATVYPCAASTTPPPATSNINYRTGVTLANPAIVAPHSSGGVCVYSSQTANVVLDAPGYFAT